MLQLQFQADKEKRLRGSPTQDGVKDACRRWAIRRVGRHSPTGAAPPVKIWLDASLPHVPALSTFVYRLTMLVVAALPGPTILVGATHRTHFILPDLLEVVF